MFYFCLLFDFRVVLLDNWQKQANLSQCLQSKNPLGILKNVVAA